MNPKMHHVRIFLAGMILILFGEGGIIYAQPAVITIKGRISGSADHISIPDALIFIKGTNLHATTGADGTFEIVLPHDRSLQIVVTCTGYKEFFRTIDTSDDGPGFLDIHLEEDVQQLGQVDIIKDKRQWEILSTPTVEPLSLALSTTTITREDILRTDSKTIIEAMAFAPGALIETRGRKVKQLFSVRGQRYPFPEFSINGVWQREFLETPYFFSTAGVERIEIIRSSAALLHGLSGMAGIVNIITKKYTEPETSAGVEYGTFNSLHTWFSHGSRVKNLSWSIGAGYDRTDGPAGVYAREKMLNLYGTMEWNPSPKISVTANIFHLNGMRQFIQAQYPATPALVSGRESYDPFVSSSVSLKALFRQSEKSSLEIQTFYTERRPEYVNEVTAASVSEDDYEIGTNIIESVSLGRSNILRFGALYNHWDAPNGKRFYAGRKTELQTVSGVIADEHEFGKWNVNAGFRWVKTYIDEYGAFGIDGTGSMFKQVDPLKDMWEPGTAQVTGGVVYNLNKNTIVSGNLVSGAVKPTGRGSERET